MPPMPILPAADVDAAYFAADAAAAAAAMRAAATLHALRLLRLSCRDYALCFRAFLSSSSR